MVSQTTTQEDYFRPKLCEKSIRMEQDKSADRVSQIIQKGKEYQEKRETKQKLKEEQFQNSLDFKPKLTSKQMGIFNILHF